MLHQHGEIACPQTRGPFIRAFVEFVWRGTADTADDLERRLLDAVSEAGDHPVGEFLALPPSSSAELLLAHGRVDGEEPADALDPALTATVEQSVHWGTQLGPFLMVYDDSKLLGRWSERLLALADPSMAAAHNITASNPMPVLPGLQSASSHDTPAVQIADVIAGGCAEMLRTLALGVPFNAWQLELREVRPLRLVQHFVWPADRYIAEELRRQGCFDDE